MRRRDRYREELRALEPARWPDYLRERSGLPGPRANLELVDAVADEGPTIKRWQPRAQGRAFPIHKPMTHITIVVADQEA
jgi:hypothetical protein